MSKSIAIVGNCQVGGLEKAIALATSDLQPKAFFLAILAATYDQAGFVEAMKGFDLVYAHASDDPQFGTEVLRANGIDVREIPVITFPAFHPDMVYVQRKRPDGGIEILESPVGDNHSALILYGHSLGLAPEQIARLFCSDVYQAVGYLDAWVPAWEELVAAGERAGLPLRSMMLSWSRRGVFMHTLNHPRVFVLADLGRAIARKEGARLRAGTSDTYLVDELITSVVWPVYPEIADHMSLEGSLLFKRAQVTQFYELEDMVRESVAIYEAVGLDNIDCWRIDLWNFLPGVRERLLQAGGPAPKVRRRKAVKPTAASSAPSAADAPSIHGGRLIEVERSLEALSASSQLPKPLRVLRKRLRQVGLWSTVERFFIPPNSWTRLQHAAPSGLKAFFDPLDPFRAWQTTNSFTDKARIDLVAALDLVADPPLISVVMPVHETPPHLLRAAVQSVLDQVYGNWELCLADDASTSPGTLAAIRDLASLDVRIRLTRLETGSGISGASNAAASLAKGDILAFLDHDDLLTPDALGEIALHYVRNPQDDIVYSDDDKITDDGVRYGPQFKPDWSPTLLLGYMYMSHLLTVRRSLFEAVGGFRTNFDGAQDYDFALRAVEQARGVGHVPRILYHWRATHGSTAASGGAKPHSFDAGRRALVETLARRGVDAEVSHAEWARRAQVGMFSLAFPDRGPEVAIVIPTYNNGTLLNACIASLAATTYDDYRVVVVDNGSDDPATLDILSRLAGTDRIEVVQVPQRPEGFSFARLMNQAVAGVSAPYILFLNDDTQVIEPRWLSQMVGWAGMEGVGAVGAHLQFADGTVQHAGIVNGLHEGLVGHAFRGVAGDAWGYMGLARASRDCSAVTAACMLTSRELFSKMGGFDEDQFAVAYNDADYGLRLTDAGRRSVYCADARLYHFEGQTRDRHDEPRELAAWRRQWSGWRDPGYNPNLSRDDGTFQVQPRRPPMRAQRPVRVIAISHNLEREGAPLALFDLLMGLKDAGVVDPVVLSPRDGPLRADYARRGVEVRTYLKFRPGVDLEAYRLLRDELVAAFRALGGEVVIANTLTTYYAVDAAAHSGLGSIWCQHESEPWETYFDALSPPVRSRAYAAFARAYRVTYVADATRRAWSGVQTRHNAQLIRHSVPSERLNEERGRWTRSAARAALGVSAGEHVLTHVGTVCRRKGQIDLVQAVAAMTPAVRAKLRVFLVGPSTETDYLEELNRALDALGEDRERVIWTGSSDDVARYYAAADIFVCTSRIESAPRVLVEAMAFGLPIITTPVFGIPEMVQENVNALFYHPGDSEALKARLLELLQNPKHRKQLAARSRDVLASQPGFTDMVEAYSALIREAALL